MIQQTLSKFNLPYLACAGLILFMLVFVGALFWVFRKDGARLYSKLQNLPFGENRP